MTLERRSWRPAHIPEGVWTEIVRADPGAAGLEWLLAHEGLRPETRGPNRGPWLAEVLRGGDGLPWCADVQMTADWVASGLEPPAAPGLHRYWHNRAAKTMWRAYEAAGLTTGPAVPPRPGMLQFKRVRGASDAGSGWHVDRVIRFNGGERQVEVIGGNVRDGMTRTTNRHGHPHVVGYAHVGQSLEALRGAA